MRRKHVRVGAAVVGLMFATSALVAIGYRTFAPSETLVAPMAEYPATGPIFDERPFSELRAAPLVVDDRLRVYAEKWRVWSDGPVGGRYEGTPYWVFRRWPAQVIGVVTASSSAGPLVVSQWSDGELIALDARRGTVAWRTKTPVDQRDFTGRRTGASTVYQPAELLTSATDSGTVIVSTGGGTVRAINGATGAELWLRDLNSTCGNLAWTGAALLALPDCAGDTVTFVDAMTGRELRKWVVPVATASTATPSATRSGIQPAPAARVDAANGDTSTDTAPTGCALGRSDCRLITVGKRAWLLDAGAALTPVGVLPEGAILAGDRLVYTSEAGVTSRPLTGDGPRWTWSGQGRLVAASQDGVYLLTDDLTMLGLDLNSGRLRVVGCAATTPGEHWYVGHVYTAAGGDYVAVERLNNMDADRSDQEYYYGPRPIALVELYPPRQLPVWPAKFAACRPL